MADTYDSNYFSSDAYDGEDISSGGEQVPSAQYLNQQIANIMEIINKQTVAVTPIIEQPTNPPANPTDGQLWLDTEVFPNSIFRWVEANGDWEKVSATSPEEIGTYTVAQIDDSLNNVRIDVDAVSARTTTIEDKVNDGDTLASTITGSQTYIDSVNALAGTVADNKIAALGMSNYVTSTSLTQTVTDINNSIKSSGGVNLLKNSVGYAYTLDGTIPNWQITSGSVKAQQGADMLDAGSGFNIATGTMKQIISCTPNQAYTITIRVKKGTAGSAYVKLSDGSTSQQVNFVDSAAYDYVQVQIAGFIPLTSTLIVEFSATGVTGGAIFTAAMVNIGTLGLQWSNANGELYNTNVRSDINGLTVFSNVYDGYTVMSPQEFSGYYRNTQGVMQKVFTLNKDTTEVAKLKLTDPKAQLTMGTLQAVYINGGGYRGWSFIPYS
jgi:hypothetical protein